MRNRIEKLDRRGTKYMVKLPTPSEKNPTDINQTIRTVVCYALVSNYNRQGKLVSCNYITENIISGI